MDGSIYTSNLELSTAWFRPTYLGDSAFEPLFEELGPRQAVIFVHPNELPGPAVPGLPSFLADFLLDTTRAALNLAISGTLTRYPDLKIILSQGGGFLPYIVDRVATLVDATPSGGSGSIRPSPMDRARCPAS